MANKITRRCGKLAGILFTSIVAPLLVNLAVRTPPEPANITARNEQAVSQQVQASRSTCPMLPALTSPPTSRPVHTIHIIVCGLGRTPEANLQNSVHTTMYQAPISQVDIQSGAKNVHPTPCWNMLTP